ncbi:MAG: 30S ribosomal protein S20 [Rickettsiales bacterium]|nr:30S ribosomal protein S20 [Rickettsiales bacterium]
MATHKSAEKAIKQTLKKTARNKSRTSKIRTFIKKLELLIEQKDKTKAKEFFKVVQSEIMRGVTKSLLKKNTAARKVSNLSTKINELA